MGGGYSFGILIRVIPPSNVYTKSELDTQCAYLVYALRSNFNKDAYMHEQTTKGFGKMNICITRFSKNIGWRKFLNEYMPFRSVSL